MSVNTNDRKFCLLVGFGRGVCCPDCWGPSSWMCHGLTVQRLCSVGWNISHYICEFELEVTVRCSVLYMLVTICMHRFSGFGERWDHSTRPTAQDSFSLWQAHPKYRCKGLRSWRAWMAFRNSRFTETIVLPTGCHQLTRGMFSEH